MKLISLNICGGNVFGPLMFFLKAQAGDTDIFCFQEVFRSPESATSRGKRVNILPDLEAALPGFKLFFEPVQDNIDFEGPTSVKTTFGQAMFVRETLPVREEGFVFTYRERNEMREDFATLPSGFQYLRFEIQGKPLTVVATHAITYPGDKLDTPARLAQSGKMKDFLKSSPGAHIACGDFNLMPQTESIRILEENMRNLIKEFGIATTRSALNEEKYRGQEIQKFADYMFVSPDVVVESFEVPNIPISDHLPLILRFSC